MQVGEVGYEMMCGFSLAGWGGIYSGLMRWDMKRCLDLRVDEVEYSELMGWDIKLCLDYQVRKVGYEMMCGFPGW